MHLLTFSPHDRPSATAALRHPFISEFVVERADGDVVPPTDVDWSVDVGNEVPERRLRRLVWREVHASSPSDPY
jgi:hypothetical protein